MGKRKDIKKNKAKQAINPIISFRKQKVNELNALLHKYKRIDSQFDIVDFLKSNTSSTLEKTDILSSLDDIENLEHLNKVISDVGNEDSLDTPMDKAFKVIDKAGMNLDVNIKNLNKATLVLQHIELDELIDDTLIIATILELIEVIDNSPCFYVGDVSTPNKLNPIIPHNQEREQTIQQITTIKPFPIRMVVSGYYQKPLNLVKEGSKLIPCVIVYNNETNSLTNWENPFFVGVYIMQTNGLFTSFVDYVFKTEKIYYVISPTNNACVNCKGKKLSNTVYSSRCKITRFNKEHCAYSYFFDGAFLLKLGTYIYERYTNRKQIYKRSDKTVVPESLSNETVPVPAPEDISIITRTVNTNESIPYEQAHLVSLRDYTYSEYTKKGTKHITHKSPDEHYRRPTKRYYKDGKVVDVKGTTVNKGKKDSKIIYDLR